MARHLCGANRFYLVMTCRFVGYLAIALVAYISGVHAGTHRDFQV